eukprot:TRINITY_DN5756_c0_g2_i2.p1 TRINITY_DN5756_c0_g2~~TRINITY_DN5756_c0_g2_i2.p1  ORF type:complete len:585 (+),score=157.35 TRINITY_DN5756_c0_g2_i2:3-1757(+)
MTEITEESRDQIDSLYNLALRSIDTHLGDGELTGDFSVLPSDVIQHVLEYLMEERKMGSTTLNNTNIGRFLVSNLIHLDLENFWTLDLPFDPNAPPTFLSSVNLNGCMKIGDATLEFFGRNCPHLKVFRAFQCNSITEKGALALFNGCKVMEELQLTCIQLEDEVMQVMAQSLTNLKSLGLTRCIKLGEKSLESIASLSDSLTFLHLEAFAELSDSNFHHLLKLRNLERLFLDNISKSLKRVHTDSFERLFSLKLERCEVLEVALPASLLDLSLIRCENIKNLDFLNGFVSSGRNLEMIGCKRIKSESLLSFLEGLKGNRSLKRLEISGVNGLPNPDRIKMMKEGIKRTLEIRDMELDVLNLSLLSDSIPVPSVSLERLTSLDMSGTDITDQSLDKIADECPNIIELKLSQCWALSSQSLVIINEKMKALEKLDVSRCHHINSVTLSLAKLHSLFVSWLNLTKLELDTPSLVTIDLSGIEMSDTLSLENSVRNSGSNIEKFWARSLRVQSSAFSTLHNIISSCCKRMRSMDWSKNEFDSMEGLENIVNESKMGTLKRIYIQGVTPLPSHSLLSIAKQKKIDISS